MPNILGLAAIALSDDAAAAFSSVPTGTTQAILTVETNAVRLGDTGSVPTATTGLLLNPGDSLVLVGNDYGDFLRNLNIINNTAGSNGVLRGVFMTGYDRA
tara:strand:- start:2374 stop:2676 length:303 start_codon:yes stop_codon:yes gene_type:complete